MTMRIHIITLFPDLFPGPLGASITGRAITQGTFEIIPHDLRQYGTGNHQTVDDSPYGGGPGMLFKPEPLTYAIENVQEGLTSPMEDVPVILLTPQGRTFNQNRADQLAECSEIILICGRYEGVDERVRENLISEEISVGDFVVTGGEIPAMLIVDAIMRKVPGVLGSEESSIVESHAENLLEGPQYTRPANFRGWKIPEILLSGNHQEITRWRRNQALLRTALRRPDLINEANLTDDEKAWLKEKLSAQNFENE